MTKARINSILSVAVPVISAFLTAFSPQIQDYLSKNTWIAAVIMSLFTIWSNISAPVHKV